jgi:hypothetical protein
VELAIARGDDHRIRPADQAALRRLLGSSYSTLGNPG